MKDDITKAFDFLSNQLGTLRLPKNDHIFIDKLINQAEKMVRGEQEAKKEEKSLTPKK